MNGNEFERKIKSLAGNAELPSRSTVGTARGAMGGGNRFTTLKDRKKEIGRDLLARMCSDLKIDRHDL